jgi:hypothetical protein
VRRCSPAGAPRLAAASTRDSRGGRLGSRRGSKEAAYLKNEGCPNNVVDPECHSGQRKVIMSRSVVSHHKSILMSLIDGSDGGRVWA